MDFTDKMCHDVAKKIINTIFLVKYTPTIKGTNSWYENLNEFLVVEWDRLQVTEDIQSQFTENEEHMITSDAMDILLDNLNIDEDEFEEREQDVYWMKFDDIIGHYICYV